MASLNKVLLIGNLGEAPTVKYTPSGKAVANFRIATTETWGKGEEKESKTEWHRIVAWGRLGEICGEYLKKGSQIYCEGKLQTRSWDDKDGNKRYTTEVVINSMLMLGSAGGKRETVDREALEAEAPLSIPEDDIPF